MSGPRYQPPPPRRGRQRWGEQPQSTPDGGPTGSGPWAAGDRQRRLRGRLTGLLLVVILIAVLWAVFGGLQLGSPSSPPSHHGMAPLVPVAARTAGG